LYEDFTPMKPTITRDATHRFTAPENWKPEDDGECGDLLVRMEVVGPNKIVECFSTWKPTTSEIAMLNAGGVIEIGLCVANQPAMQVGVVEPVVAPRPQEKAITINEDAHGHG